MKNGMMAVGLMAVLASWSGAARADSKCSDFDIIVTNNVLGDDGLGKEVDVIDFSYFDVEDDKWRNEWVSNHRINYGSSWTWNHNLEYVGGETIKIQIEYQVYEDGHWSSHKFKTSPEFTCVDSGHREITLTAN